MFPDAHNRAVLLYAQRCPKCRFLSRLVTLLALGAIERVPLEHDDARRFYDQEHPEAKGYPALVEADRFTFGARVLLAVPRLIVRTWTDRFMALLEW